MVTFDALKFVKIYFLNRNKRVLIQLRATVALTGL